MQSTFYKPGQGYWTRVLSCVGFGMLVLAGVAWLWAQFEDWFRESTQYWQAGMAIVLIGGFGYLLYRLIGRNKKIVDFMIATEAEMKKVNWPSRGAVVGLTAVVIAGTLLMALYLTVFDIGFAALFRSIGILK